MTISVAMLLGHESPPANPVRGRVVQRDYVKPGPRKPPADMPESIRPGTRVAKAWRVLPDPDDVPLSCGEVAREMREKPTAISAVLTSMVARGVACRHTEANGSYGYTRAVMDAYELCEHESRLGF